MENKNNFISRAQNLIIIMMVFSFFLIIQKASPVLYKTGLIILIVSAISQMAFGNADPTASPEKVKKFIIIAYLIVASVFGLGIFLAPFLVNIGR
jgi:hypothetical protein